MRQLIIPRRFPANRVEQAALAEEIVRQVVEGETDPLRVHVQISSMEGMLKQVKESKEYRLCVLDAAEQQNEKTFSLYGAEMRVREVGVKYDYSECGDPVWERLNRKLEEAKTRLREREIFLSCIPVGGQVMVDEETGECYRVYPPVRSSTTAVTVTLK